MTRYVASTHTRTSTLPVTSACQVRLQRFPDAGQQFHAESVFYRAWVCFAVESAGGMGEKSMGDVATVNRANTFLSV